MERFNCEGWLKLVVDLVKNETQVTLTHYHHAEYVDVQVSEDLKEYIRGNLHQTPRPLWNDLALTGNVTEKQLHR